ncbi:MAG: autoinducer binding domain-containing protein, partial [Pseudomonas sp.]|nr:autoinducer binding domain-containing protein [Pseudomonas sp.]
MSDRNQLKKRNSYSKKKQRRLRRFPTLRSVKCRYWIQRQATGASSMPHWKSEQLQQLLDEQEPKELFGQAVKLAQALNMEFVGLALHLHVAARGPQVILYNNYPGAWNERYQAEDLIKIDPTVSKCHHTTLPLVWNDDLYCEVPQLREAATALGMTHGWSQSVHDQQHMIQADPVERILQRQHALDLVG